MKIIEGPEWRVTDEELADRSTLIERMRSSCESCYPEGEFAGITEKTYPDRKFMGEAGVYVGWKVKLDDGWEQRRDRRLSQERSYWNYSRLSAGEKKNLRESEHAQLRWALTSAYFDLDRGMYLFGGGDGQRLSIIIRDVLALHRPTPSIHQITCQGCYDGVGGDGYDMCDWPCPTFLGIEYDGELDEVEPRRFV